MLIVTGANGTLGPLVVDRLLARIPASELGVSVREPDKARAFADRGVRVRHGDFEDAASLASAFQGATDVLIISASAVGEVALRRHTNAIDAAVAAGAKRIVYTSHMGANSDSEFLPMRAHAATEKLLAACGIPFVSLRNGFYASTPQRFLAEARETGELVAPADGPVSWTTHADLADAAAIALTERDHFTGISPPLTGAVARDLAQLAHDAGYKRVVVSDDEYRERLVAKHVPAFGIEMTLGMFRASRAGEFAAVDPALAKLLGRATQ